MMLAVVRAIVVLAVICRWSVKVKEDLDQYIHGTGHGEMSEVTVIVVLAMLCGAAARH